MATVDPPEVALTIAELYDQAPIPYVLFDAHGIIQALNARASQILGLATHQGVGFPLRTRVALTSRDDFSVHLARLRSDGVAVTELEVKAAGGKVSPVRLESRRTAHSASIYWSALFDVSLERESEAEHARLIAAERTSRDAVTIKDRFIAVLSHELRAPLAPILAAISSLEAEMVYRGGDDRRGSAAKVGRLREIIKRNVLREARLIEDLLDVSRIASGKVELSRRPTDLHLIATEALEMSADDARARRLSLCIELQAARHGVDGDPSRLRQVFSNLIRNAVKFTPEGGAITVRSWNHQEMLAVEVSDTGIGIPPEALARVFESFEQVQNAAGKGGLGLGLAIARGLIEQHGGKISAHSAGPGRGARFVVELPALAARQVPTTREDLGPRLPPQRAPADTEILVIEDEPDLAEALLMVLESQGYRVQTAATASAALSANLDNVSVVISDLGLPDLDGRVLLPKLKSKHPMKAIALSGYGTEADIRASADAGFDRHLTKPVEMDVLLGAVDRACSNA